MTISSTKTKSMAMWGNHIQRVKIVINDNSYILFSLLGGKKISHRDFRNILLQNLLAQAGHNKRNVQRPVGRPPAAATQLIRFDERGRKYWPIPSVTWRWCGACATRGVTRNVSMIYERCNVALCCDTTCFRDYHNQTDPWNISDRSTESPYLGSSAGNLKFKIWKIRFYLGNRILWIFNKTAEIYLFYSNIEVPTRCTCYRVDFIWRLPYVFRVWLSPIFRSTKQL